MWCGVNLSIEEDEVDGSAVSICDRLITGARITLQRGRTLFTDNYYTSVKLAKHLFEKYGWTMVGTISPTDKKSRQDKDFPFLKLSNGARLGVKRGWFHEAMLKIVPKFDRHYYIQATTWRDKKQVCFLSSNGVGSSHGLTVKRHNKGKQKREEK